MRVALCSMVVAVVAGVALPAAAKPARKGASAAVDDLAVLPIDSEVVISLDFQQLQTSALWKELGAPELNRGEVARTLGELARICGFDPVKVVIRISMGLRNVGGSTPTGVILAHGITKKAFTACVDGITATTPPPKDFTFTIDGDVLIVEPTGGQAAAFTSVGDAAVLIALGASANKAGIAAILASKSTLSSSPAFVDLHTKTNTKRTLWFIANGNALGQATGQFRVKAISGSLQVAKSLSFDMRAQLESEKQARELADLTRTQLDTIKTYVDSAGASADGSELRVTVEISDGKLRELIELVAQLL